MELDVSLLRQFEAGLDPRHPEISEIKATIIGYGEISAIFKLGSDPSVAYKRMPLFKNQSDAETYEALYHEYCDLIHSTGIRLPETGTTIVNVPGRPVTLYIAQQMMPAERFCHQLIHTQDEAANIKMVQNIVNAMRNVWRFKQKQERVSEIALDSQLSNWVALPDDKNTLVFIDTSTPMIKLDGEHRIDANVLLDTMPGSLKWFIKKKTVREVLDRYYDPRLNMIDLIANLFKEQRPDLVPVFISAINEILPTGIDPITKKCVTKYYKEDKAIWALFLRLRKLDRWVKSTVLRKRYDYILPGPIKR